LFNEKLLVYGVIDNYDEYFSAGLIWRAQVHDSHRKLLRCADVVFAVSELLLDQCLEYNPNSFLAPNGVSFELFRAAMEKSDLPPDIRVIPRPIIGFAGVLHSCIDFNLLEKIAVQRADWSLVVVGPKEDASREDLKILDRMRCLRNVYYLGPKAPDQLPEYIKCFDVGLMPYRIGPLTRFGDSLKLYEYMACGKPVVSTAIPAARRFVPLVEVADDLASFLSAIERVLKEPDGGCEARLALARDSSWDRRISDMSAVVLEYLKGKAVSSVGWDRHTSGKPRNLVGPGKGVDLP
jgi:glycosyltransferase involved in cell wall biosynthesis